MTTSWLRSANILLCLGLASWSGADWKRDYMKAVQKVEGRQYGEAIPLLQKALREKPASCAGCIREGMFIYDYFPNYYLGKAFLATGQNEAALACLQALQQEGVIQGNSKLAGDFQKVLQSAQLQTSAQPPETPGPKPQEKPAEPPPPIPAETPPEIPAPKPPGKPSESPPAQREPVPSARPGAAPNAADLESLKERFERVRAELERYPTAILQEFRGLAAWHRVLTDRVDQGFRKLQAAQKDRKVGDLDFLVTRLQAGVNRFGDSFRKAKALRDAFLALPESGLKQYPDLHREYRRIADRLQDLKNTARQGEDREETNDELLLAMDTIQKDIIVLTSKYESAVRAAAAKPVSPQAPATPAAPALDVSAVLKEGYLSYFKGDFSAAEASLKSLDFLKTSHPYQHFLRAVIDASHYLAGGEKDAALARQAKDAFQKAQAAGLPQAALSETYFSPKVLALLRAR